MEAKSKRFGRNHGQGRLFIGFDRLIVIYHPTRPFSMSLVSQLNNMRPILGLSVSSKRSSNLYTPLFVNPAPRQMDDLPNELYLTIAEYLESHELYALCLLSKRLHYSLLPVYLHRYGMKDEDLESGDIVFSTEETYTELPVPGLRIALFISVIKTIHFALNSNVKLASDIRGLAALIRRTDGLQTITINLSKLRLCKCEDYLRPVSAQGSKIVYADWHLAFQEFLHNAASRKSCTSMVFEGGTDTIRHNHLPEIEPPDFVQKPKHKRGLSQLMDNLRKTQVWSASFRRESGR